jgi:thymidylate synthase ThyX
MTIQAHVLCDSVSLGKTRLTTLRVTMPRFVLAEFNTHRVFSRNAGSSRAISVKRRLAAISANPVLPVEWGIEQKGMQASAQLTQDDADLAERIWRAAAQSASWSASQLAELGVHKQVVNRLLEPFSWVDAIVTSTEWDNFFRLRLSSEAQPEMHAVAAAMREALHASVPTVMPWGGWHLPTITDEDRGAITDFEDLCYVAAGRLARVSYEAVGKSWASDRDLARSLVRSGHWSPFEHVAVARQGRADRCRNFLKDWDQLRALLD